MAVAAGGLAQPLDAGITMEMVRQYVDSERQRSRRVFLWTSSIFVLVVLVVLSLFILLGIFVLGSSRDAATLVVDMQEKTAGYASEIVGISDKLGEMEQAQTGLKLVDEQMRTERQREGELVAALEFAPRMHSGTR